jgi:hypothetical protein
MIVSNSEVLARTMLRVRTSLQLGSISEPVLNLESFPLFPLIGPGEQIGNTAHARFANRISAGERGRKVQQLHLNIRCQVGQAHDLANAFATKTREPSDVGIVLRRALLNHVIKMYRESQYLCHTRKTPRCRHLCLQASSRNARTSTKMKAHLKRI